MVDLYIACVVLVAAVTVNSISVYMQKRYNLYTRRFGGKDQMIHSLVILPFWIVFVVLASQLHDNQLLHYEFINLLIVGTLFVTVAVALFIGAMKTIGTGALVNANFFRPQKKVSSGVYRYFKNPIYDSYAILLFGLGLIYSNWGYIVLSALVWLLLICIESRVEKV